MTNGRQALEIRPFGSSHLDAAAALLAERHRRHRRAEPPLDPTHESPETAGREISAALAADGASAWVATREGAIVGYMIGSPKADETWGPNIWIESAGHAATEPEIVRELYAVAAAAWVKAGRTNHHVLVPATDAALVDAWFRLDFGQQHVHAVCEPPSKDFAVIPRSELIVRAAQPEDIPVLAELELVLPRHSQASPVFSRLEPPSFEQARSELEADWGDPKWAIFVAEHDGRVIGSAVGCALELSSGHTPLMRPTRAGFLGFAAVLPDARGLGAGRALGEAVLAWTRDAGYDWATTDWRSTNLEAARTWPTLGFRPTFRRLHRSIT
ncbi:MAG: GNAT family N-acetyltransferase [Chloroflexi bacterium]|nr:MAG: GNAT family N-acetyltransferase [Chloroflexota bacterium]